MPKKFDALKRFLISRNIMLKLKLNQLCHL